VVFEGGKVICGLRDQLVFGRSNFRVSEEGMLVLERVAQVLNAFPDLEVLALGHTSNQAAPQGYIDNWGLSARRAAALVRTLTEQFDVSANQLTAAGKGEFQPKVSNGTPEGQATNRRMEFVLSPRLDLLYRNILTEDP
jgi:chemotaxis protein MotB